eukprot:7115035-Prymnesium_polylepis.1
MRIEAAGDDAATADDARKHVPAAPPRPEMPFDGDAAPAQPSTPGPPGLKSPPASVTARYAAPGERLGPTPLPFGIAGSGAQTGSAYSPYVPPPTPGAARAASGRAPPLPTPLPPGAPRRASDGAASRVPSGAAAGTRSSIRLGGVYSSINELSTSSINELPEPKSDAAATPRQRVIRRLSAAPKKATPPPPITPKSPE